MLNLKAMMKQKTLGTAPALGALNPIDDEMPRKPGILKKKAFKPSQALPPMKGGLAAKLTGKY